MSREVEERIKGAKSALLNSIMFYRQALLQAGHTDTHKEIATEVSKALLLSDKQEKFLLDSKNDNPEEILDNISILLKHMVYVGKLDKESINLILKGIKSLKGMIKSGENN